MKILDDEIKRLEGMIKGGNTVWYHQDSLDFLKTVREQHEKDIEYLRNDIRCVL